MENEANAANFEELDAHIKRISGKLAGMNPGTESYAETKELMEDYYERLVSMKNMSINTLQCRLAEVEDASRESSQQQSRQRTYYFGLILALVLITLFLVEDRAPGIVTSPFLNVARFVLNSPPVLVISTAVIAHLLTKWKLR